jgi:hypothetical protein
MAGDTHEELRAGMAAMGGAREAASGFLSWMHWVEQEVRRLPDLLEGLGLLKGAMMGVPW